MKDEEKLQLYSCIKRQFTDAGLYKLSRVYEWLFTNGFSPEKMGYGSFEELCEDFPEVFMFQDDRNSGFILIKDWHDGNKNISGENKHPADNFFGTKNIILNDDIIEMTQQSLYALSKILGNDLTVQQMKQVVFSRFEEAGKSDELVFLGDKYIFPIERCHDGQMINGIITKNLNSYGKSLYFSFEKARTYYPASGIPERKLSEIPDEEKRRIYDLLCDNFTLDKPHHMAAISKLLTDRGVDRIRYGYGKMKDFLAQLPFLELKEIVLGGVPQYLVTIRDVGKTSVRVAKAFENDFVNNDLYNAGYVKNNKIPLGRLSDFCNLPVKPMSILKKFIEENGISVDFFKLNDNITEDFETARKNGTIRFYGGKMIFPIRYKKSDGTCVELTLKPSAYEGKEWFLYYVDTFVRDSKLPVSAKYPENYAFTDITMLRELKALAADEEWDLSILSEYLRYTLKKIISDKKFCVSRNFAAFNTGLADKNYDDIFACFEYNENGEYELVGFCTAYSSIKGKNIREIFERLPRQAVYFANNEALIFDTEKYMYIDYERLFFDNIEYFPLEYLSEQFFDVREAMDIIPRIKTETKKEEQIKLYDKIKELYSSSGKLAFRIQNSLRSAVETAGKRVKRNFRAAVPAYLPDVDSEAFMIPLALIDGKKPDAALAVEITRSGSYQARTVLSLRRAYICSRLVCGPQDDWLSPNNVSLSGDKEIEMFNN